LRRSASQQSGNLDISVHDNLESLEPLRPEWDALLEEFPSATTFSTWEWLVPWWRAFGERDQLRVLGFRDPSSGSLAGIAPLGATRESFGGQGLRVLRLMGDGSADSDNLDLPVRSGDERRASAALLTWLEAQSRDWDFCRFHTLPSDSPFGSQLCADLRHRGWTCFTVSRPHSVVELPEGWESYLKMLSGKERGKIGLRTRRLEKRYRVQIYRCAGADQLDAGLEALFRLHARHWQGRGRPGSFQSAARRQFYRDMGAALLARGRLNFWLLELDGRIAAAQFGFRHGAAVFSLQEGFDPDYSSDSVGYVLRSQVIRQLISEGVRRYDFLGGSDESKARWAAQLRSYIDIDFARPYTRGSVYLVLTHSAKKTKEWLRARLPSGVWRALKAAADPLRKP
jgi:CelD/BcsL family acetyltransferase involved in cellulose biosynthesis